MDFAKRMLEKYGWSEGQGLGKDGTGMTTALKPKVKLNSFGLGHDRAKEFTYRWWEDAFNEAARNVNVEQSEDGPKVKSLDEDSSQVSVINRSRIKRDKNKYDSFVKRETLTKKGVELGPELETKPERLPVMLPAILSDEQLFQACGGLTAHKGARHGLTLKGKLQRVKEQEEALLKAFEKNRAKDSKTINTELGEKEMTGNVPTDECKLKRKKSKTKQNCEELVEESSIIETSKNKKKKKKESECCYVGESELSDGKESKKSKKKRKHEMTESLLEDVAETNVNPSEDEVPEKIKKKKKKDRNVYKEVVCEDNSIESPGKKHKKKRKTEEMED